MSLPTKYMLEVGIDIGWTRILAITDHTQLDKRVPAPKKRQNPQVHTQSTVKSGPGT